MAAQFAFPPALNEDSSFCLPFSPAYGVFSVLDFGSSNRWVMISHFFFFFLICSFLMTDEVEHLSYVLFVICVSSLVRWLFRSFSYFEFFVYFA